MQEYKPSAWGAEFHALTVDVALGGGSAGPGKTTALIIDPMQQVVTEQRRCVKRFNAQDQLMAHLAAAAAQRRGWVGPSNAELEEAWNKDCYHEAGSSTGECLHLRRLAKSLDQSMERFKLMYRALDPKMEWNESKLRATFSSGYKYSFGHCKDPDDYLPYYGKEYSYIAYDELVQFLESQFDHLNSRVRSSDWVLRSMLKIRAMSNPAIVRNAGEDFMVNDPYWVRRLFVDPHPEGRRVLARKIKLDSGKVRKRTLLYLPARLRDNPDPEFVEDYEFRLRTMKPHIKRALLDADWYVTAGSFYSDHWIPHIHVCQPFAIPFEWPVIRAMDWGFKKPGCVLWGALDPEGTLWVFREYNFQGRHPDEVATRIKEIETEEGLWKDGRSTISGAADTQLWEERGNRGQTMAEVFASAGVGWIPADKKSRRLNAQRFCKLLDDHDDGSATPGIVFFSVCKKCITTIPAIPTIQEGRGAGEEPLDGGDDHAHDTVLYLCALASRYTPKPEEDRRHDRHREEPNYGADGYGSTY
jgi:hypothetical protein